ncbi:prepilin peptidase [Amycolatopsis magusensis]|uniref:Leader peptidase (Prepilin peptidase)/N-methyltransferase n=1 Tax=Amycolatopsis magusensis TaxID=882444 RepID=A0ABS4PTW4_9PSEU|nr:prepilin peptidase [Amycolatopsis magusensis]MBP2182875.1 leader peptidase (prepilin peptidase)/N-methyltransferase [Amycolatopsis magusensis]
MDNAVWVPLLGIMGAVAGASMSAVTRHALTVEPPSWWTSPVTGGGATAVLIVMVTLWLPWNAELAVFSALAVFSVPLVVIDIAEHRLPTALLGSCFVTTTAILVVTAWVRADLISAARSVAASIAVTALLLLVALLSGGGLGAGDVKLGGVLGLLSGWVSWSTPVLTLLAATTGAAVLLACRAAISRRWSSSPMAFGPFLLAGVYTALVFQVPT